MENVLKKFKIFLLSEEVKIFYKKLMLVSAKIKCDNYNYIGINYSKSEDVKLYFTFFDKVPIKILEDVNLFSRMQEYTFFSNFYCKSLIKNPSWQNTGITFSIKQTSHGNLRTGFHLRGKLFSSSNLYIPPQQIELTEIDLVNYQGVYFEYENNKIFRKNYYYISDLKTKQHLATIFDNNIILEADIVEYTESELGNKVILWKNPLHEGGNIKIDSILDNWLINSIGNKCFVLYIENL